MEVRTTVPTPKLSPRALRQAACLLTALPALTAGAANAGDAPRLTHPLLPGVRSAEVWNPAWPRTLHDKQLTGFSPLLLGMKSAPREWATIPVGGELGWTRTVTANSGERSLLVNDGGLRRVDLAPPPPRTRGEQNGDSPRVRAAGGAARWSSGEWGSLLFAGDLRGNGKQYLLLGIGPRLSVVEAETGKTDWVHVFEPAHVQVRAAVGDVLPDRPGLEVAVFQQYGEEGCLIQFPPQGEPQFVWKRTVIVPGQHPERYDHGCDIRLDESVPGEPVLWNVRHHRCRGFNARTGEPISSLVYPIGGGHRRNYGPWAFGRDKAGRTLICVAGEAIQTHVHAIRLNRAGPSEVAWQHYYGEVYEVPGVAVKSIAMEDLDGDGETEMLYNVRDPAAGFRSFVRVRAAGDGTVKAELADHWCAGLVRHAGADDASLLLALPAPAGATPEQGNLEVYRFDRAGRLALIATLPNARRWGPAEVPGKQGNDLLVRQMGVGDVFGARARRGAGGRAPGKPVVG